MSIHPGEFLKGINVHDPEFRDYADELILFLKGTPIEWVRLHPLTSRKIRARNHKGVSYLDAIEKFARAGLNLILPIDVGVRENVGVVNETRLRRFVDDSYSHSYVAVKQIETRLAKYDVRVIYGVENEIDTKEWILQSMPNIGWRETPLAWARLSADKGLKYKRLGHILEGIRDAAPGAPTLVNFEADDPAEDWTASMSFLLASQAVLSKMGFLAKDARVRMNNYRIDVAHAMRALPVDIIGLDNYPNYFKKIPPKGTEVGSKVDDIARKTGKPVINLEFGYTAFEPFWERFMPHRIDGRRHPLEEYQRQFFANALGSIESSASQGTFPWVLMLDPARNYSPGEENGFALLKVGYNRNLEPVPALHYYLRWLEEKIDDKAGTFGRAGKPSEE